MMEQEQYIFNIFLRAYFHFLRAIAANLSYPGHAHQRPAAQVSPLRLAVQGSRLALQPLHQAA
jgi:hypothetical protein